MHGGLMPTAENDMPRKGGKPEMKVRLKWRRKLWNKQQRKCHYCMVVLSLKNTTLDHVVPQSKGGRWAIGNLVWPASRATTAGAIWITKSFCSW